VQGELLFDLGKKTWFPAVHGGKKKTNTAGGIFSALFGGQVAAAWKRMTSKGGIEGNMKGEGFTLGGVWVVHPHNGVIYEYREKHWGDSATDNDMQELQAAINKLPGQPGFVVPPSVAIAPPMAVAHPCGDNACSRP